VDFDAAVERLKEVGVSAGTVLLFDDEMLRVAVVWPRVHRTVVQLDDGEEVADVWDLVSFSPAEVTSLAGIQLSRFGRVFSKMCRFGFIYPDGTVAKEIRGVINSKLSAKFGQGQRA